MSFDVPDSKKEIAEKAQQQFETLLSNLKLNVEYMDFLYIPLKKCSSLNSDVMGDYRDTFMQFQERVKAKYDESIKAAFHCMLLMNEFGTDTPVKDMMSSFDGLIKDLEKFVNIYLSIFSNLNSPDFKKDILATTDTVRKCTNQIKQLVNDRVIQHIDDNILAKDWSSELSNKFEQEVDKKIPLVTQLYEERQRALKQRG